MARCILTATITVLFACISVNAKVYERWSADPKKGPPGRYGWQLAYESEMNLNGLDGVVRVYGVEKPLHEVISELEEYYQRDGYSGEFFRGSPMAWGVGRDGRSAVRYFLQEGANHTSTLINEIQQPLKEYLKTLEKPLEHHLEVVPVFPGSTPTYFMHDYGSGMATEISSSRSSPETITDHYHRILPSKGWKNRIGEAGSMRVFEKGNELILISASQGDDGESRITRVHKKLIKRK